MAKFVARRILTLIPILFGVSVLAFLLMKLVPGDTATVLLGPYASESALANLRQSLGLDQPIYIQYFKWLSGYFHGDLGTCFTYMMPVSTILGQRLVNSAILTGVALVVATVIGAGGGMIAGVRRFSIIDRLSTLTALFLISAPTFWLGLMLMYLFSLKLGWLPAQGMYSLGRGGGGFIDLIRHLPLPAIAAAANSLATIFRITRSETIDILGKQYILTARARGLSERSVIYRHALRNMLPSVVNIVAMQIGFIFGGALFAEVVFNWPGIGQLIYTSISSRDIAVLQAALLVLALIFVTANLVSDVVHALVDPRTRRS